MSRPVFQESVKKGELTIMINHDNDNWDIGRVSEKGICCYKQPDSACELWGQFDVNSFIPIRLKNDDWYETYWDNDTRKVGYVRIQSISNEQWINDYSDAAASNRSYIAGHFGKTTKTGVRVRTAPGSNSFTQVVKGSMFYIEGTENGPTISGSTSTLWVKVRFGRGNGTYVSRYIHSSCFGNTTTIIQSAKKRIVDIAKTLEKNTGNGLDMGGEWCQRFIYWLCGACGMLVTNMPFNEGYCGPARLKMVNYYGAEWHQRGDGYIPDDGDLIYYGALNSNASRHVGLVVEGGNDFSTIEGNIGSNSNERLNKVALFTGSVSSGKCNDEYYQGFLKIYI